VDGAGENVKGGDSSLWNELLKSCSLKFEELNQLVVNDYFMVKILIEYLAAHEMLVPSRLKSLGCF
jgi:hypothetical protein